MSSKYVISLIHHLPINLSFFDGLSPSCNLHSSHLPVPCFDFPDILLRLLDFIFICSDTPRKLFTLKRFSFDGQKKRQDLVDIPLNDLSLSRFVSGYNAKQYVYNLYAVCNHSGNTQGGHYTAFVKTNKSWTHFNDSQVQRNIPEDKIITPKAYCLFYRKK